jgi:hypothetical protein
MCCELTSMEVDSRVADITVFVVLRERWPTCISAMG